LGVEVTQYYRGAQILRGFDDEARGLIAEMMRESGIDLHVGSNIVELCPESDASMLGAGTASDPAGGAPVGQSVGGAEKQTLNLESDESYKEAGPLRVTSTNGSIKVFDAVLFATGRAPNSRNLGLEEAGVKLGRKGEIEVDDYSQTSVPSIYAIGDVTDRMALTPVAIREGDAFTETVFKGNPTKPDHDLVPSAIFTQPEMGTIGMTEQDALERGGVEIYSTSFRPMNKAFAGRSERVLMKLIVDAKDRTVLGCHIVSDQAGEMIQLAGIAIKMGATKEDFDRTVAVHPTMAEELVTMQSPVRTG
ncbi:hypothetical protein LCGC14_2449420, partial [marine sediment metagenome]